MQSVWLLIMNSVLLGFGLAMDAFSVSLVNGMNDPAMSRGRQAAVAGTFAGFQFLMPMIGWICVRTIADAFAVAQRFIPWIAMGLLTYIGGKMLWEALGSRKKEGKTEASSGSLLMQGIATSIDALSAGFTMAEHSAGGAALSALIIGAVTFAVCLAGLILGRKAGTRLAGKASAVGGVILIGIGLEILLTHLLSV